MKLADWRKEWGGTQEALASELGVDRISVARYEAGARKPEEAIMLRLFVLSRGAVQPNDFYDLPALQVLSAANEREAA